MMTATPGTAPRQVIDGRELPLGRDSGRADDRSIERSMPEYMCKGEGKNPRNASMNGPVCIECLWLFGFSGSKNETHKTNQMNQTDQPPVPPS